MKFQLSGTHNRLFLCMLYCYFAPAYLILRVARVVPIPESLEPGLHPPAKRHVSTSTTFASSVFRQISARVHVCARCPELSYCSCAVISTSFAHHSPKVSSGNIRLNTSPLILSGFSRRPVPRLGSSSNPKTQVGGQYFLRSIRSTTNISWGTKAPVQYHTSRRTL